MLKKIYYLSLYSYMDAYNYTISPYSSTKFKDFIQDVLGLVSYPPFTLTDSNVEKMWQILVAEKRYDPVVRIIKDYDDTSVPNVDDGQVQALFEDWTVRLLNIIAKTYDYYTTLLNTYAAAQSDLMADIKATSKNKVKFNDTPQNPNNDSVYEGDNYITHFTSTEGETSSPLTSKIMRLKEIQDHYKRTLRDWVNEVGRVFYTEKD